MINLVPDSVGDGIANILVAALAKEFLLGRSLTYKYSSEKYQFDKFDSVSQLLDIVELFVLRDPNAEWGGEGFRKVIDPDPAYRDVDVLNISTKVNYDYLGVKYELQIYVEGEVNIRRI